MCDWDERRRCNREITGIAFNSLVRYHRWMTMVDISGLPRNMVLRALVNRAKPLRMGLLDPNAFMVMTDEQAEELLKSRRKQAKESDARPDYRWDYIWGRPIKTNLNTVLVNPAPYDRDQGSGAMQRVVDELRKELA